jgi:hypothetical protein
VISDFGVHAYRDPSTTEMPKAATFDLGVVRNFGRRNAVGATVFASTIGSENLGLSVRFRRWSGDSSAASWDAALGIPIVTERRNESLPFVMWKFAPSPLIGLSARAQLVRQYPICRAPCSSVPPLRAGVRPSIGAELGGRPGAATFVAFGVLYLLIRAAVANGSYT